MTKPTIQAPIPKVDDEPALVQFIHPGREYVVRGPCPAKVPWVGGACGSGCSGHFRRLVAHEGEFIDGSGKRKKARLAFWGEWEAETTAMEMPSGSSGNMSARWVHTVNTPLVNRPGPQNTDPCVFGSTFKYCCCQQRPNGEMRKLAPGSVILFGSRMAGCFWLDTVFVVAEAGIPYEAGDASSIGGLCASREYRALTLDRLTSGSFSFYRGKTFATATGDGLYSFVPARPFIDGDARYGERFALDLAALNKKLPNGKQTTPNLNQGFSKINVGKTAVASAWREIQRQVRSAGFVPAVHFDWPQ